MENNFYSDDFEQLLKEKADQFRMYPSKRVWHSIYNNLHPSRRWPSAVISILFFFSLVFTGYLNTSDNSAADRFGGTRHDLADVQKTKPTTKINTNSSLPVPSNISQAYITEQPAGPAEQGTGSLIPVNNADPAGTPSARPAGAISNPGRDNDIIRPVDTYIKAGQVAADAANANNKISINISSPSTGQEEGSVDEDENVLNKSNNDITPDKNNLTSPPGTVTADKPGSGDGHAITKKDITREASRQLTAEEKAWIENYALLNKPSVRNKWKDRMSFEFYVTPAVNYRKLTTRSKGSASLFATGDINRSISQKPGLGVESGLGLSYAFAKNLRLKAGVQFNYTNYNIDADQTNHPVLTTILLNDPNTGYSYLASRTSSLSNAYNSSALQPVVLHNRTYQLSVPIGLAYKLSGKNNVEWFAGATVQPTYVFGGKAHLISSDLKSYVYDPSSIRNWNLNLGFETYMSYKLGAYNLQVGPEVRYQVYSTYRKNIALIEKPYAVGLKIGLIKGF